MSKSLYSQEPDKNYYQNCIIHGRFQFDQTVTLVSVGVFVYVYISISISCICGRRVGGGAKRVSM